MWNQNEFSLDRYSVDLECVISIERDQRLDERHVSQQHRLLPLDELERLRRNSPTSVSTLLNLLSKVLCELTFENLRLRVVHRQPGHWLRGKRKPHGARCAGPSHSQMLGAGLVCLV
jgi:hypothetical protein